MISGTQRQERRGGTLLRRYNTLMKTKTLPNVFKKDSRVRRGSININKIYENSSQHLKFLGSICALLSILIEILIFYETELYFNADYIISPKIQTVRGVILMFCFIQSFIVLLIHLSISDKSKISHYENFCDLVRNRKRFKYLFIDVFISMIHTPPGVSATIKFTQLGFKSEISYSDIIFPISLLRVKFLIVFVSQRAEESKKKAQIILALFYRQGNIQFILKAIAHKYIYSSFLVCMGFILVIFGLLMRDFEKYLRINNIYDSMWIVATTVNTVGYGNQYPYTHLGRLIAGLCSIIGIFLYSYNINAIREIATLQKDELKLANNLRYNNRVKHILMPKAAELIQKVWKARKTNKETFFIHCRRPVKEFKFLRLSLKNDISVPLDQHITNAGSLISSKFGNSFNLFKNLEKSLSVSKKYLINTSITYKKLRRLTKNIDKFVEIGHLNIRKSKGSIPSIENLARLRKKAMRDLFVRRNCNSPQSNISPSLSYTSID